MRRMSSKVGAWQPAQDIRVYPPMPVTKRPGEGLSPRVFKPGEALPPPKLSDSYKRAIANNVRYLEAEHACA